MKKAARAALAAVDRHVTPEQVGKVKRSLPEHIRSLWPEPGKPV